MSVYYLNFLPDIINSYIYTLLKQQNEKRVWYIVLVNDNRLTNIYTAGKYTTNFRSDFRSQYNCFLEYSSDI